MTVERIKAVLRSRQFSLSNEAVCQVEIAEALESAGIRFIREYWIGAGERIDFLCGRIGIEIKLSRRAMAVARQIKRYDECAAIDELILVTRKDFDPTPIGLSKPLHVVWLSQGWL